MSVTIQLTTHSSYSTTTLPTGANEASESRKKLLTSLFESALWQGELLSGMKAERLYSIESTSSHCLTVYELERESEKTISSLVELFAPSKGRAGSGVAESIVKRLLTTLVESARSQGELYGQLKHENIFLSKREPVLREELSQLLVAQMEDWKSFTAITAKKLELMRNKISGYISTHEHFVQQNKDMVQWANKIYVKIDQCSIESLLGFLENYPTVPTATLLRTHGAFLSAKSLLPKFEIMRDLLLEIEKSALKESEDGEIYSTFFQVEYNDLYRGVNQGDHSLPDEEAPSPVDLSSWELVEAVGESRKNHLEKIITLKKVNGVLRSHIQLLNEKREIVQKAHRQAMKLLCDEVKKSASEQFVRYYENARKMVTERMEEAADYSKFCHFVMQSNEWQGLIERDRYIAEQFGELIKEFAALGRDLHERAAVIG